MQNFAMLNKKEINALVNKIKEQFGISKLGIDYIFFKNKENKIYIINKNLKKLNLNNLKVDSMGLYFCKMERGGIRMTIEGSQLIGDFATRNILELNKSQLKDWIRGNPTDIDSDINGYFLIKNNKDFFGCGLVKDKTLLNYFPKNRRLKEINE